MIDLVLAREHLKADDEDVEDGLIERYIASAKSACEGYCNRKFYEDETTRAADYIAALAELKAAKEARDAALAATDDCDVQNIVNNTWISARANCMARCNGVVIDDTITAAMLMMLGHFYRNREEVVVGQYSGASQLPAGAKRILEPYLWIGDLGGDA